MAKDAKHERFDKDGSEKIQCKLCECWYHRLDAHLGFAHKTNVAEYNERFPGAPTISATARHRAKSGQNKVTAPKPVTSPTGYPIEEAKPVASPDTLHFGCVQLKIRRDLGADDGVYVPKHNPNWMVGKTEEQMLEELGLAVEENSPAFIYGPTGCGKSTLVEELAAMLNQPCVRVQLNQRFTTAEFVGFHEIAADGTTVWRDGLLPQAMRNGWWLLLDEITAAPAGILMKLQAVLEGKPLVLTDNGGEVVVPHASFRFMATDNTNGRGDDTGLYAGTNVINEATLDRFGVVIKANYPAKETEVEILMNRTRVNRAIAEKMVTIASKVREALANEMCYCTFSTRRLIAWASKAVRMRDARRAAQITVVNKLSADDAKFVDNLIQRYFGGDVA